MEWHFLNNQFDNVTKESNLKMVIITYDHHSRLKAQQADPDILELLTRTTPLHEAFLAAYNKSKSAIGLRKSSTLAVNNKLKLLRSTTLRHWEAMVQVEFLSGTEEYTAIFPNGLTAFHTSTIDQTVIMLGGLEERLDDYPDLADVKDEVGIFQGELEALRDAQQMKEQIIEQSSALLEQARVNLARMMYANLGKLMDKYRDTPDFISNFWELRLLKSSSNGGADDAGPESEEFTGTVGPMSTVNITSAIAPDATIIITNTGSVTLRFCDAPDALTGCTDNGLDLAPGGVHQAMGSDFQNPANTFFNVTNNDPAIQGNYNVEVVSVG